MGPKSAHEGFVELRGDMQGGKGGLDCVRQAFNAVTGLGLEVERSTPVVREPESNRNTLHSWVFKGGDGGRKGAPVLGGSDESPRDYVAPPRFPDAQADWRP